MSGIGVALVTGASRGIGRAIASRLLKDGYHVALSDLPSERARLEEFRGQLPRTYPKPFISLADVSVEGQVEGLVSDIIRNMGGLDVMVANAGICPIKYLVDTTADEFDRVHSINVKGVFYCYKHAARQMIKQGRGGRIVSASSLAGKQGHGMGLSAYSSSKFAIRGLTQSASSEFAKYGITVNAYAPGIVDTEMGNHLMDTTEENGETLGSLRDAKNICSPDDVAALVSYLVSEEAGKVTGQSVSALRLLREGFLRVHIPAGVHQVDFTSIKARTMATLYQRAGGVSWFREE